MICERMSRPLKTIDNSGFTLIEVLIAMAIFAIGFLAVGVMQINALNKTNSARQGTEAMIIAEEQVEMLRAIPFYDNESDLDGDLVVEPYDILPELTAGNHTAPPDNTPYTVRWTVIDDEPLPAYDAGVLTAVGVTPPKRSKTIRLWVTPDNNSNDVLADITFVKFKSMDNN